MTKERRSLKPYCVRGNLPSKIFINELQRNKDHLYHELEIATDLKNDTDFNETFGVKITATTREKIFKEAIEIFKLMRFTAKGQNHYEEISQRTIKLSKRIKLHFYQIKKLKQDNYNDNVEYFTNLLRVIYSFLLKKNLLYSKYNGN
jgi:hypothetical protein